MFSAFFFIFLLLLLVLAWLFHLLIVAPLCDPLKLLQGPSGSYLTTHIHKLCDPDISSKYHHNWVGRFGKTFKVHGFGKHDYRLISLDLHAITHILRSSKYEKPWQGRTLLTKFFGRGVFTTEGAEHAFLRRITSPALATPAVKELTPILFRTAEELRDCWLHAIDNANSPSQSVTLDISSWCSRASVDTFGTVGLNYHFNTLSDDSDPLYAAFRNLFGMVDKQSILHTMFPNLEKIWPDETTRGRRDCLKLIHEAGSRIIANKKAVILDEKLLGDGSRDLLSLIIKSNLNTDPARRLSDAALLDLISSFLFAGSDSTSLATTWCLHFLSLDPAIQSRLRDEIKLLSNGKQNLSSGAQEAIMALPLLDYVVREALRLCPPTHTTLRVAMEDDLIPLSSPIILRNGKMVHQVKIRKGSFVHIPIEGLNYDPDIWGQDAAVFNPDRWANPPVFPGIANIMTFLMGPHSCPGYKLSIAEVKAFVATLLLMFNFQAVKDQKVRKLEGILMRPRVNGESALPMVVSMYC